MSDFGSEPQTVSAIRSLLATRGLKPNRRFGQHFLVEPRLLDLVTRLADIGPEDVVLEVGTGTGNLTNRLSEFARLVISVEIDSGMHALARDLLGNRPNVRLIHGDIMESKTTLNAEVCEKIDLAVADPEINAFKVVANLPYNISTPFISSLLIRYGAPDRTVLTVQKELATNLVAEPGSKDYSPLSILTRLLCDVRIERAVAPEVFWPRPRVDSAIVVAKSSETDTTEIMRAFPLIQFLFRERRKAVRGVLRKLPAVMGGPFSDETVATILQRLELTGLERAESLEPGIFLRLDRIISERSADT